MIIFGGILNINRKLFNKHAQVNKYHQYIRDSIVDNNVSRAI